MPRIQAVVGALRAMRTGSEAPLSVSTAARLPLSHRLSIVYLATPVVIWILGWFNWWVGVPIAALLIAGLWRALSGSWRVSLSLRIVALLMVALAWILINPLSGLWQSAGEIVAHYNIMLDMDRGGWPTYLTDYLNDNPPLLGYYLGWHIVPGLVGRELGTAALGWAVPLWTWIGIGLIVIIFTRGLPTLRAALLAASVLIFFSGMDTLDHILSQGPINTLQLLSDRLNDNLPWGWDETTPVHLKYQSTSETLWWSPQHLIASGLVALIILQSRQQPRFAAISVLMITICIFWSPLSAVGLIPLVITLVIRNGLRPFLKWPNLIAAPPLAALIAFYLLNNDLIAHYGWLWDYYTSSFQMVIDLIIFYITEFLLLAWLLWRMDRRIIREPIFVASLFVLFIAPWYVFGSWYFNSEIILRFTVPALIVLNYYTAYAVIGRLPEMTGSLIYGASTAPRRLYVSLIAVLAVGTVTVLFIFLRSSNRPAAAYEQTANTSLISTALDRLPERTIRTVPRLLQSLLRNHDQRGLSTGEPIVSTRYDIYHNEPANMIVYLNRNCVPELEKATRFFLQIYPADGDNLPETRKQPGFEIRDNEWDSAYKGETNCIGSFGLPDYEMTHIIIGQYHPYLGDIHWRVQYRFDGSSQPVVEHIDFDHDDIHQYYDSYYQLAAADEPAIRSTFDVHLVTLHQNSLLYTKEPCSTQDTQPNFFLHIFPADINDLPSTLQQVDFDNYDFRFEEKGVILGDKCLAIIQIPDYGIANIRTGQFDPAQNRIFWQDETTPQSINLE